MRCKICYEEVDNMNIHWKKHKNIVEAFDYINNDECCMCGGKIKRYYYGDPDDAEGWNISCEKCGFLYDED